MKMLNSYASKHPGECFGFFAGEFRCLEGNCALSKRCQALSKSDGLEVFGDLLEDMLATLPEQRYVSSNSLQVVLKQILSPERTAEQLVRARELAAASAEKGDPF